MNTKKVAFSLGGFLAVTASVAAVISCGSNAQGETTSEQLAKQYNEKIKKSITTTEKKITDIIFEKPENPKNVEFLSDLKDKNEKQKDDNWKEIGRNTPVDAQRLGIEKELAKIGEKPKNSQQIFFVINHTTSSATIRSLIMYDAGTPEMGMTSIDFTIKTANLSSKDTAEYNRAKIDSKYLTNDKNISVAILPKEGEKITPKQLGIEDFKFEGNTKIEMTVAKKNESTDNKKSGTVKVHVTFEYDEETQKDAKLENKAKIDRDFTVYGFKESKYSANKEEAEKIADQINKVSDLSYPGTIDSLEPGKEVEKGKIKNFPPNLVDSKEVKLFYQNDGGNKRVEATITVGEGEFQQYVHKIENVKIKFQSEEENEKQILTDVLKAIKDVHTTDLGILKFKDIKKDDNPLTKEQLNYGLKIDLKTDENAKDVRYVIASDAVVDERNQTVTIKIDVHYNKQVKNVDLVLNKFDIKSHEIVDKVATKLGKFTDSTRSETEINAIKKDEKNQNMDVKVLNDLLGISLSDSTENSSFKDVTYDFVSVEKGTVKVNVKVNGTSASKSVTITFKKFAPNPGIAKTEIEKRINQLNDAKSKFDFNTLNDVDLNTINDLQKFNDQLGLELNFNGIEMPQGSTIAFALANKQADEDLKTITFNVIVKVSQGDSVWTETSNLSVRIIAVDAPNKEKVTTAIENKLNELSKTNSIKNLTELKQVEFISIDTLEKFNEQLGFNLDLSNIGAPKNANFKFTINPKGSFDEKTKTFTLEITIDVLYPQQTQWTQTKATSFLLKAKDFLKEVK